MTDLSPYNVWPFLPNTDGSVSISVESPTHKDAVVRIQTQIDGVPAGEATEYNSYAARQLVAAIKKQIDAGEKSTRTPSARDVFDGLALGDRFFITAPGLTHALRVKVGGGYINPALHEPPTQSGAILDDTYTKVELS